MTLHRKALTTLAAAAIVVGTASAQQNKPKGPEAPTTPQAAKIEEPNVVATYGLLILVGAAMIGVSLIPSKRGHKD